MRLGAAQYAIEAMSRHSPICSWIIDDTGMLKQGKHSVGVQHQYIGSAGKVANCQIAVTLTVANKRDQLPVDTALYLPVSWTDDPARRKRAHMPDQIEFRTKPDLALAMIQRALRDGIPPGVLLADAAYGTSSDHSGIRPSAVQSSRRRCRRPLSDAQPEVVVTGRERCRRRSCPMRSR